MVGNGMKAVWAEIAQVTMDTPGRPPFPPTRSEGLPKAGTIADKTQQLGIPERCVSLYA